MTSREKATLAADARACPCRENERSCSKARCRRFRRDVYLSECVENIGLGVCPRPRRDISNENVDSETPP